MVHKNWIYVDSRIEDDTDYCQLIRVNIFKCPHCGYLTEIQYDKCPKCSEQLTSIVVT